MVDNAILRRADGSHRIDILTDRPTQTNPKLPRSRLAVTNTANFFAGGFNRSMAAAIEFAHSSIRVFMEGLPTIQG